jgi:hypothetical protein
VLKSAPRVACFAAFDIIDADLYTTYKRLLRDPDIMLTKSFRFGKMCIHAEYNSLCNFDDMGHLQCTSAIDSGRC